MVLMPPGSPTDGPTCTPMTAWMKTMRLWRFMTCNSSKTKRGCQQTAALCFCCIWPWNALFALQRAALAEKLERGIAQHGNKLLWTQKALYVNQLSTQSSCLQVP